MAAFAAPPFPKKRVLGRLVACRPYTFSPYFTQTAWSLPRAGSSRHQLRRFAGPISLEVSFCVRGTCAAFFFEVFF